MRVKKCSSSAEIFSFLYFFEVNSMHVLVHSTKVAERGARGNAGNDGALTAGGQCWPRFIKNQST